MVILERYTVDFIQETEMDIIFKGAEYRIIFREKGEWGNLESIEQSIDWSDKSPIITPSENENLLQEISKELIESSY